MGEDEESKMKELQWPSAMSAPQIFSAFRACRSLRERRAFSEKELRGRCLWTKIPKNNESNDLKYDFQM